MFHRRRLPNCCMALRGCVAPACADVEALVSLNNRLAVNIRATNFSNLKQKCHLLMSLQLKVVKVLSWS